MKKKEETMKLNLTADISSIEETLNAVKGNFKKFEQDTRQFRPNLKNDKKEYRATIRFIPQGIDGINGKPYFVERWDHMFQENGMWYIEKCPSVINKVLGLKGEYKCPVCESRRADYNSKQPVLIERAKSRKLKKSFVTNILVIDDPQFPENNGKVLYWNLPKEIIDEIQAKWKPESKKKAASNPYCPMKGYAFDLILKINPESGYPTYKGSEWLDVEPIAESEDDIVKILSQAIDLNEFAPIPSNFKPYEELKGRFVKVTMSEAVAESQTRTIYADEVATPVEKIRSQISTSAIPEAAVPTAPVVTDENEDTSWMDD